MSSSTSGRDDDAPDLVCQIDCVHGMVDALSSVRWKRHQDAVMELSAHGIVLTVEESGCLQSKVFLKRELFVEYDYAGDGRERFGLSLGLFVDCLNIFSAPGHASAVEIRSVDSPDACLYAEIRTRIPDTISWDYNFEHDGNTPVTFTVKSAVLKETIDDLEWPGSSIQIRMQPDPPTVVFKGEGHGDLQVEFPYYANTDLLIVFQCDREVSYRYKYKFLRATTSNIPSSVMKENRRTKVTIGRGGMLKIQHLISLARPGMPYFRNIGGGTEQTSRIAHIEFFVKPEEDDNDA
ncbi:hypothetical protein SEVIR_4G021100v4 [Setaria viridis]|uniref:Cell cycle checkpoint protein RAD1 n=1 Tax=Setaria viridis TaxID=4556 RepID=A0A4U6USK6_SETVI|nr:hypothetical protein SEVIR_4G021100v2 [Setaria viridis]